MNKSFIYHENASGDKLFTRMGDAWLANDKDKIFAVADSPFRYLTGQTREYPYDDFGYDAANIFCTSVNKFLIKEGTENSVREDTLLKALKYANNQIHKFNNSIKKKYNDPLNYDLAETVGVAAIIRNSKLYYGGLEDCYVNVLRGTKLENVAKFNYQILKSFKYLKEIEKNEGLSNYVNYKVKQNLDSELYLESCWCNMLRNNHRVIDINGDKLGWGCFTGEKVAEKFFQIHSLPLKKNDYILLFSDGMIPLLENNKFLKWLISNYSNTFNFQHKMREKIMTMFPAKIYTKEKTLLLIKY